MDLNETDELRQRVNQLSQQLKEVQEVLLQIQQKLNEGNNHPEASRGLPKPAVAPSSAAKKQPSFQHSAIENFIGLKIINLVGIVVLLIGISIGVKYAIDKNLITPLVRILLAYAASAALLLLSLLLKKNYEGFSAILFSGAMVSMYFTTYGAFTYYNFFSQTLCFIIMAVIAVYTAARSLQYNRQEIAVVSMVGAYAIPLLISANHENYLLLFSYILVMNAGILVISFKRSWKLLTLLALIITWSFFIGWLLMKYENAYRFYALAFLCIYFILFLLSAFAFTLIKKTRLSNQQLLHILINNFALFISLLVVFSAPSSNISEAAVTAFCGLLFLAFAVAGNSFFHQEKMLNRMHYAAAFMLAVLFISIQYSGLTITMLWTLLAVMVFILGIVTKTIWPRLAAIMLVGLTLLKLVLLDSIFFTAVQKIIAYITIGTLLLVLSFFYQKFKAVLFADNENKTGSPD
ncbi:DUF2339 domain-containing protein [Parafilimonas sp.]|uniref:DUF2339 domain-containing protein n=1 Tax=Parafilimonas sp. TaxID=1969739 RepID=UPI0039E595AD